MNTTSGKIIGILFSDLGKDEEDWNSGNYIYDNDDTNSVNLKCCGNCKHYEIDLEGEIYNGHSYCLHRNEHGVYPYKICENWQWNNRAFKDRFIGD